MTVEQSRAEVVSSFTIIKGSLIDETYAAFANWDFDESKRENLERIQEDVDLGGKSQNWLRDVARFSTAASTPPVATDPSLSSPRPNAIARSGARCSSGT